MKDEYQCLTECPIFGKERRGRVPLDLINRPCMYGFMKFIQCQEKETYNKVRSFVVYNLEGI